MAVVRGELGRGQIARAALEIVAVDGLSAVSMRRIADALGVWPTAVYHHVGDKDGLVGLVLDAVLDEMDVPDHSLAWDEWLRAFATACRSTLLRYPGVAAHLGEIGNSSRAALTLMDGALGVLGRGGFGAREALLVFVDFFGFVLSRIRREEAMAAEPGRDGFGRTIRRAEEVGPDLPHLDASREHLTGVAPEQYLLEGVEMFVRGAEALRVPDAG